MFLYIALAAVVCGCVHFLWRSIFLAKPELGGKQKISKKKKKKQEKGNQETTEILLVGNETDRKSFSSNIAKRSPAKHDLDISVITTHKKKKLVPSAVPPLPNQVLTTQSLNNTIVSTSDTNLNLAKSTRILRLTSSEQKEPEWTIVKSKSKLEYVQDLLNSGRIEVTSKATEQKSLTQTQKKNRKKAEKRKDEKRELEKIQVQRLKEHRSRASKG
jgi:hypothetical protein